jgi:hypothetical protein
MQLIIGVQFLIYSMGSFLRNYLDNNLKLRGIVMKNYFNPSHSL